MTRHPARSPRHLRHARSFVLALVTFVIAIGTGSAASAGGWAVASLDAVPVANAGQRATVGFTILQHGVTPVDLLGDPSNEVGIEIRQADGTVQFFPASGDGTVGHYVTTVEFPAAGTYAWSVRMGWFGPQDLGTLVVQNATGGARSGWPAARTVLLTITILLAGIALADLFRTRRRTRLAMS